MLARLMLPKNVEGEHVKNVFTAREPITLRLALGLVLGLILAPVVQARAPLRRVGVISLPNVKGRIDHFSADVSGRRLFISALGNHTVEVVDIRSDRWLRSLSGVKQPQGEYYVTDQHKLFTADGLGGDVRVYEGANLRLLTTVKLALGPDAEAYDPVTGLLYVGYGGGAAGVRHGEVGIINAVTDRHVGDIRTSAHPGTILVGRPGHTLFITVPRTHQISRIDARTGRIGMTWLSRAGIPVSLALDRTDHRLFVGMRNPAGIEVFDSRTGGLVASLPSVGLMDGLFYDALHHRIYASGGQGYVAVYRQFSANHYGEIAKVPTGPNARTSLWVKRLDRYYVAVPAGRGRGARILVFHPEP